MRSGCRATLWSVGIVFLLVGSCVAFRYGEGAHEAGRINAVNRSEAGKLIASLEQYRVSHGRYPSNLMLSTKPHMTQGTHLLYTATADGQRYWVGVFPHRIATLVLPADDHLMEYDSQTRSWSVVHRDDAHAKDAVPE